MSISWCAEKLRFACMPKREKVCTNLVREYELFATWPISNVHDTRGKIAILLIARFPHKEDNIILETGYVQK